MSKSEKLRIALFEPDANLFNSIKGLLKLNKCLVAPLARTIAEAQNPSPTVDSPRVDGAFVGHFNYPDPDVTRRLISEIRNNYPWIYTISMSTTNFSFGSHYDIFYGDIGADGNIEWLLSQVAAAKN